MPLRRGARTSLPIELLCSHFNSSDFNCGFDLLNDPIASCFDGSDFVYDPDQGVVLVAHEDGAIRGYVWIVDLLIRLDGSDPERCFYLAYLGVDQRWQGSDIAGDLIRRAYEMRRRRSSRKVYAATLGTTMYDPSLDDRFRRMRFKRVPENPLLWYRRPSRG